jgi:hypothetical protein
MKKPITGEKSVCEEPSEQEHISKKAKLVQLHIEHLEKSHTISDKVKNGLIKRHKKILEKLNETLEQGVNKSK